MQYSTGYVSSRGDDVQHGVSDTRAPTHMQSGAGTNKTPLPEPMLVRRRASRRAGGATSRPLRQNSEINIFVPTKNRITAKIRFNLSTGRLWAKRTPRGAVRTLMMAMEIRAARDT